MRHEVTLVHKLALVFKGTVLEQDRWLTFKAAGAILTAPTGLYDPMSNTYFCNRAAESTLLL